MPFVGVSQRRDIRSVTVSVSSAGNTQLVEGVPGRTIRVCAFCVTLTDSGSGPLNFEFRSGSSAPVYGFRLLASSDTRGVAMSCAAPSYLFSTAPGSDLNANLSSAPGTGGVVVSVSYWLD